MKIYVLMSKRAEGDEAQLLLRMAKHCLLPVSKWQSGSTRLWGVWLGIGRKAVARCLVGQQFKFWSFELGWPNI
jgi:hypothetical protein